MDQEKVGKFIKDIRIKNNLTQNELAKKLGVTYQAVSKWENGKSIPDILILKEISKMFNVNIEEILDGHKKINKKRNIYIIIIVVLIILISLSGLFFYKKTSSSFEFKTLSTTCKEFNITGSLAYNKDKTSIYISNINYCSNDDNKIYDTITCNLYEENGKGKIKISECNKNNNISLKDYLKNIKINSNHYSKNCNYNKLYLEIEAINNNTTTTYKIPLTLKDNCN